MKSLIISCAVVVSLCALVRADTKFLINAPPPSREHATEIHSDAHGRSKRQTCGIATRLTAAQAEESVFIHNIFRGNEPGSNLLQMSWSNELAALAQALASTCTWGHGMLNDCSGNGMGQNLFLVSGSRTNPPLNMTAAILAWNNERIDYNFAAGACNSGKVCGHWTQVVDSRSTKVGCGAAQCASVSVGPSTTLNNVNIVVCNYSPPGNMAGRPMYLPGTPCSNCDSEQTGAGFKCVNNLCASCTPASDSACTCGTPLNCQNGGIWMGSTCSCSCPNLFYGAKCEKSCVCRDVNADNCNFWIGFCKDPLYADFMTENCLGTCKNLCNPPASCRL